MQLMVVGRLGVLTANVAALADQEAGKQEDAHAHIQLLHMVADRAEDIPIRPEDVEAEFPVKRVRPLVILLDYFDAKSKFIYTFISEK